jgi:hypothetical protein
MISERIGRPPILVVMRENLLTYADPDKRHSAVVTHGEQPGSGHLGNLRASGFPRAGQPQQRLPQFPADE